MFAIKNAHLISALTEGFEGDYADVVVDGGKFVDILPSGAEFEDMEVFDAGGKTLMPGMFDLHMHICLLTDDFPLLASKTHNQIAYEGVRYANEFLRQGFTTIRDCGNPFYIGVAMRDAFAQNLIVGPRMIVSGKCITPYAKGNSSFPDLYYEANTEEELLKACRYEHALGTDFLKYMGTGSGANLTGVPGELVSTRREIFAMQSIAESLHTTLAVHCHGTEGIKYAAEAGVHTIEHASLIDDECIDILLKNNQRTAIVPTLSPIANTALGEDSGRLPQIIVEKLKYLYSYFRKGVDQHNRPILFAFNGGPGASCSQLHLGAVGPTRIPFPEPNEPLDIYSLNLIPNEYSPLDVCDIVMIDPPGTGYGRILKQSAAEKYFSVDGDAAAIALLIESWLLRYDRFSSPIYIMGESYGTIRAPQVAANLTGGVTFSNRRSIAIPVAGVILIGSAGTDVNNIMQPDSELPEESVLALPIYAATHWYHHMNNSTGLNREFVEEAYQFSAKEYLPALYLGKMLEAGKRQRIAEQLEYYTGVNSDTFLKNGLRLSINEFKNLCCAGSQKEIGIYDSRYTVDQNCYAGAQDVVADDAAMGTYMPAFTAAMNHEKCVELGIPIGMRYDQINFEINGRWNFASKQSPLQCLAHSMQRDPAFRVFMGSGYYDFCTLFTYIRAILNRDKLDMRRVCVKNYEAGHLVYLGTENAAAFGTDIRAFIAGRDQ